jgi:predicted nucleic acid-binding protein
VITWLLDTGPLVCYLIADEPAHQKVSARLNGFDGQLVTTSAVVTEAMHFVARAPGGPRVLAQFLDASTTQTYDFSRSGDLRAAVSLMEKYSDVPMDFADATLLLLAEGLQVEDVLTLDRRGFSAFRTRQGRPLRLVLDL